MKRVSCVKKSLRFDTKIVLVVSGIMWLCPFCLPTAPRSPIINRPPSFRVPKWNTSYMYNRLLWPPCRDVHRLNSLKTVWIHMLRFGLVVCTGHALQLAISAGTFGTVYGSKTSLCILLFRWRLHNTRQHHTYPAFTTRIYVCLSVVIIILIYNHFIFGVYFAIQNNNKLISVRNGLVTMCVAVRSAVRYGVFVLLYRYRVAFQWQRWEKVVSPWCVSIKSDRWNGRRRSKQRETEKQTKNRWIDCVTVLLSLNGVCHQIVSSA